MPRATSGGGRGWPTRQVWHGVYQSAPIGGTMGGLSFELGQLMGLMVSSMLVMTTNKFTTRHTGYGIGASGKSNFSVRKQPALYSQGGGIYINNTQH